MNRKFLMLIFLIFAILLLSGCSGSQQLNQKLIVQGVAVDKTHSGYKVVVQALDFQNPLNENEPNTKILETEGWTVMEALGNIPKQTSLKSVYSQNLMLILGSGAAKMGVNEFIDFFIRHCETRPKVKLCVSKDALEVLKIKPGDKQLKSRNVHDLIPEELGSDILHFVSNLKNGKADPFAAWIEPENENGLKAAHLKGVGVFKQDKLEVLLEDQEAFAFMILKGVKNFGSLVVNSEKTGDVTCTVENAKPKISVKTTGKVSPEFSVNLDIEASSFSLDKNFYTHSFGKAAAAVEEKISEKIKVACTELTQKTLALGIDVFEFSKILKNSDPKYFRSAEENWKSILPKIKCEISVKTKLKATGKEPV